jgi:Flp pilus assembly protein TadG
LVGSERDERGDAMVLWCLLLAVLLLPLGGLSVDLWHGIAVQRQLQSAAEDAALAGASGIDTDVYRRTGCIILDPASASALAAAALSSQAGLGQLSSVDIAVSADRESISVELKQDVSLTLLSWVEGGKHLVVAASASSGPDGSAPEAGCQ